MWGEGGILTPSPPPVLPLPFQPGIKHVPSAFQVHMTCRPLNIQSAMPSPFKRPQILDQSNPPQPHVSDVTTSRYHRSGFTFD